MRRRESEVSWKHLYVATRAPLCSGFLLGTRRIFTLSCSGPIKKVHHFGASVSSVGIAFGGIVVVVVMLLLL